MFYTMNNNQDYDIKPINPIWHGQGIREERQHGYVLMYVLYTQTYNKTRRKCECYISHFSSGHLVIALFIPTYFPLQQETWVILILFLAGWASPFFLRTLGHFYSSHDSVLYFPINSLQRLSRLRDPKKCLLI